MLFRRMLVMQVWNAFLKTRQLVNSWIFSAQNNQMRDIQPVFIIKSVFS